MGKKRVFTKMVPADAKYQPAVRIQFKGKHQSDYFSLKKIAEEEFSTNQTNLGRLIICEWLNNFRTARKNGADGKVKQMVLNLSGGKTAKKEKAE